MSPLKWTLTAGAALGLGAALVWALRPDPLAVDIAEAVRAPMEVTVSADGMTRVRDPFVVTAPLSGVTSRSPVRIGDSVTRGETVIAVIQPAEPAFLDARARLQAEATVAEAEATLNLAEVRLAQAEADLTYAENQFERNEALAARGVIAQRLLDESQQRRTAALATRDAALSERDLHRATLARTRAQLIGPSPTASGETEPGDCCIRIIAPLDGTVLGVEELSPRLVQAGAPLMTIGDLSDLEIEVDLLSTDAVRVRPGAPARIGRWGGDGVIAARVRALEPGAFTRVSALGISEQRVRAILDIETPPEGRTGLGHRYQIHAAIVIWAGEDVLQVPQSALFRQAGAWAVFRVEDGRARLTPVEPGQVRADTAQILRGLAAGDRVVAYPGNQLADGARIAARTLP